MPHLEPQGTTLEVLLRELHNYAACGDLESLKEIVESRWELEEETDMSWVQPNLMERCHKTRGELSSDKAVALQRVFITAVKGHHVDIASYLLSRGHCVISPPAVRNACVKADWNMAQVYLDHGWDINRPVEGGNTMPILSELITSIPHIEWLLDHGANPMAGSISHHKTIPGQAAKGASLAVLRLLKDKGVDFSKSNALHDAAASKVKGRIEIMDFLLDEAGVPLNAMAFDYDQRLSVMHGSFRIGTALHSALWSNNLESMKYLIGRDIDQSIKDGRGRTAAEVARQFKFHEALPLLE
ncbi:ankyrin [Hypomontagnella monticulosa]|nr:ankyrin [Hypomontagnella monticulosa]